MIERITRMQDLRVGDIFLGPIGGLIGAGVGIGEFLLDGGFRVGDIDVRHAGIVVTAMPGLLPLTGDPRLISTPPVLELAQAMPSGAEITTMTYDRHWTKRCLYVRLPEDYPGQAEDAAAMARLMVREKVAYSFASYAALALHVWTGGWPRLDRWIARRREVEAAGEVVPLPVEAICSVFVDQAWTLASKQVMPAGTEEQVVTPATLAKCLVARLADQDGTIIGVPGLHPFTPTL